MSTDQTSTNKNATIPSLYLGTMTFGWSQSSTKVNEDTALKMMKRFTEYNCANHIDRHHLDTARIYAGGKTETILGNTLNALTSSLSSSSSTCNICVDTKAHPSQPDGLSPEGIENQLKASLHAMKLDHVNVLYFHQPDTQHSLLESLKKAHELVSKGLVKAIGLSNYHVSEVERAFSLCDEHSLTKPTIYQGLYNPFNRLVEVELLPLLKQHNCAFVAYNPLAAGLLTGKHKREDMEDDYSGVKKGRFQKNKNYLPRFFTSHNFDGLDILQKACQKEAEQAEPSMDLVEVTFRWLLRHSDLDAKYNDGIIVGASSISQLGQNLKSCSRASILEPLPQSILDAFDEAWEMIQTAHVFPYWRSYSSDMPNREHLEQGASYSSQKK